MTASPEFTSWLKEHHHPELTYWEVWQAGNTAGYIQAMEDMKNSIDAEEGYNGILGEG